MSKFYGTLVGARGEATRCGTSNSGIKASVQSWDGSVISRLYYDDNNELVLSLETAKDSTACFGRNAYYGSLEKFQELMDTVNKVGVDQTIKLLTSLKEVREM